MSFGVDLCEAVKGDCKGRFFDDAFVRVARIPMPPIGSAVNVSIDDAVSLGSDQRTIVLVADDNLSRIVGQATVDEGQTATFDVDITGSELSVWCDKEVVATVVPFGNRQEAAEKVEEINKSILDSVGETLKEEKEKADKRADRVLLGVGIIIVVVVVAAAIVLPSVKIPTVKVS